MFLLIHNVCTILDKLSSAAVLLTWAIVGVGATRKRDICSIIERHTYRFDIFFHKSKIFENFLYEIFAVGETKTQELNSRTSMRKFEIFGGRKIS